MSTPDKLTPGEVRAAFRDLHELIDGLHADIASIRDGLAQAANHSVAAQPATGSTVTFDGVSLIMSTGDDGQPTYKIKGGQYQKFGVRVWPEVLTELGIQPETLKPGPNPIHIKVVALLGDNGPRKIIGLA